MLPISLNDLQTYGFNSSLRPSLQPTTIPDALPQKALNMFQYDKLPNYSHKNVSFTWKLYTPRCHNQSLLTTLTPANPFIATFQEYKFALCSSSRNKRDGMKVSFYVFCLEETTTWPATLCRHNEQKLPAADSNWQQLKGTGWQILQDLDPPNMIMGLG